ncbi:MAG: hypothetical protein ACE5PM_08750 [Candidatus Hydrothermarchaeales archaeon]
MKFDHSRCNTVEAEIAKEEELNSIRVVEKPIIPQKPSGPSKKLNMAVAGILCSSAFSLPSSSITWKNQNGHNLFSEL